MPNAQNKSKIDARRFAALFAGVDTGNSSEEEATAKFRALRRMAEAAGMRVVDVLELPEIRQAIDAQMGPNRQDGPALREALEQAASMQEELTERTRNVRELAERLRQQEEQTEALNRELRAARSVRTNTVQGSTASRAVPYTPAPRASPVARPPAPVAPIDWRQFIPPLDYKAMGILLIPLALVLLFAMIAGAISRMGGLRYGPGSDQVLFPPVVQPYFDTHPLPGAGSVPPRMHRRKKPARTR